MDEISGDWGKAVMTEDVPEETISVVNTTGWFRTFLSLVSLIAVVIAYAKIIHGMQWFIDTGTTVSRAVQHIKSLSEVIQFCGRTFDGVVEWWRGLVAVPFRWLADYLGWHVSQFWQDVIAVFSLSLGRAIASARQINAQMLVYPKRIRSIMAERVKEGGELAQVHWFMVVLTALPTGFRIALILIILYGVDFLYKLIAPLF